MLTEWKQWNLQTGDFYFFSSISLFSNAILPFRVHLIILCFTKMQKWNYGLNKIVDWKRWKEKYGNTHVILLLMVPVGLPVLALLSHTNMYKVETPLVVISVTVTDNNLFIAICGFEFFKDISGQTYFSLSWFDDLNWKCCIRLLFMKWQGECPLFEIRPKSEHFEINRYKLRAVRFCV